MLCPKTVGITARGQTRKPGTVSYTHLAGLKCHIDFETDAVQVTPGAVDTTKPNDALMAEWGIEVWLNADQSINQVEEK